ncbi:MAG: exodeoxyribonuclease V subunit gamma [Propionibacteriaceae bacterium]|jgi:exodeoxyribonuclease V gamma subunit|nr:exodeoxyribonuclease V subunit gamma [Propionibacteriaceae bacterium]
MSSVVHYSAWSGRALVGALAEAWAEAPGDPFALDLVVAPGKGTGRWLAQELSLRLGAQAGADGVTAGVEFLTLDQVTQRVLDEVTGGADPWRGAPLVAALLGVFEHDLEAPWGAVLRRHLGEPDERPGRRVHVARRLARLIERYRRWDPDLVTGWLAAAETAAPGPAAGPAEGPAVDPAVWQAGLARALAARLGPPAGLDGRATSDPLPRTGRVAVVCPEAVDPVSGRLLERLADHHDVTLLTRRPPAHPVARSLTRLGQAVTTALSGLAEPAPLPEPARPATFLGALQAALTGEPAPAPAPDPADGSFQVHSSHAADRQVDVLRDLLLTCLEDDQTLEPRDILVVCPRLAEYQGWLDAAFAEGGLGVDWTHPGHSIRARVSGAWVVPPNPVADALAQVLALADSRATASELLALAANPAVQARFGLAPADLDRLADLVYASGLRWGISAAHRRPFGLAAFAENTWSAGLARLALGVAAPPDELTPVGTALPLERVGADDIPLVGALLELTGRVRRLVADFAVPAAGAEWLGRLHQAVDLLTLAPGDDAWQRADALGLVADLATEANDGPANLTVADVAAWLDAARARRRGRDRVLTGDLNICAPQDLRHVPHKVVVWLGLDADSFPRRVEPDGDDLLAGRPDLPNPTLRDRQAFADSLLDAADRFAVVCQGHDPRDNSALMLPAPVRDLLSVAADLAGPEAADTIVRHHPAHPFSLVGAPSVTFDAAAVAAARALVAGPGPRDPSPRTAAPPPDPATVTVDDLAAALAQPAAHFLRWRAGLTPSVLPPPTADDGLPDPDAIPLDPGGLARWQVTDRIIQLARAGRDPFAIRAAEPLRGQLPPKALGRPVLDQSWTAAGKALSTARPAEADPEEWVDVDLAWPGLPRLTGQVAVRGDHLLTVQAGRARPKGQLAAWVRLLAVQLARPEGRWSAVIVGPRDTARLFAPPAEQAGAFLARLLDLYLRAGRAPLPLPCQTGLFAAPWFNRGHAVDQTGLEIQWSQEWGGDAAWRLVWPDRGRVLWDLSEEADWTLPGPRPRTRFEALVREVYVPLVRAGAVPPQIERRWK